MQYLASMKVREPLFRNRFSKKIGRCFRHQALQIRANLDEVEVLIAQGV